MLWEVWRYFDREWIERYWIDPILNFTYYGFDWVKPWPGEGMYLHFVGLGILAVFITLGLWYRISTVLFFLGFTYVFLLEEGRYLNHFYLICLLSFLLIFLPAHRTLSLDVKRHPSIRTDTAPAWTLWLLRLQIGIPYFYGGLAKLNGDWLQGEPMRMWMARRTDFPLIGSLFTEEWMIHLLSYGGLLLDLGIVPFLIWRRTRPFAFAAGVVFHLMNARLFAIGIFPWFMIAATAMFFPPDWPRRILGHRRVTRHQNQALPIDSCGNWSGSPPPGDFHSSSRTGLMDLDSVRSQVQPARANRLQPKQSLTLALLGLYLACQLLVPLRHYLYPGNPNWTEEGHRFAWHMKLRQKTGRALFAVVNRAEKTVQFVEPEDVLPKWQVRKMATRPHMVLQFSHFLAEEMGGPERDDIEVYAEVFASLNGRDYQPLIDSTIDLSRQRPTFMPASWILPLEVPLSQRLEK